MKDAVYPEDMLAGARAMNEGFARSKYENWGSQVLHIYAYHLGKDLYRCQPHWHAFTGQCTDELPFEVYIQALSLLSSAWVADIYLRKARDRKSEAMTERFRDYRAFMNKALDYIETEVALNRDIDAEKAFQRHHRPPTLRSRLRCFINRMKWGH